MTDIPLYRSGLELAETLIFQLANSDAMIFPTCAITASRSGPATLELVE
jgi:hypothetical protein